MSEDSNAAAWRPLKRTERRIVGVLIEKAKTTPDQYPLSLNALINGCNQKSNRSPQMNLQELQVEDALVKLRQESIVGEVQGGGRVAKYRHYMKDWLGVSGPELAVMAELLLRGDQTIGELRGRANRMTNNEIADIAALRPVLDSLFQKGLIVALTPAGRGQSITHALYLEDELATLRQKYGGGDHAIPAAPGPTAVESTPTPAHSSQPSARATVPETSALTDHPAGNDAAAGELAALRSEVHQLRDEVARLKKDVEDLWSNLR